MRVDFPLQYVIMCRRFAYICDSVLIKHILFTIWEWGGELSVAIGKINFDTGLKHEVRRFII